MLSFLAKLRKPFVLLTVLVCVAELCVLRWNDRLPWRFDPPQALKLAALIPVVLGVVLRAWSAGIIVKREAIAQSGPYRLMRHPLYGGSLLMALGYLAFLGNLLIALYVLGYMACFYTLAMIDEERKMVERFGAAYERYMACTRRLLPTRSSPPGDGEPWSFARFLDNKGYMAAIYACAGILAMDLIARYPPHIALLTP